MVVFENEKITLKLQGGDNNNIVEREGWKITPMNHLEVSKEVVCMHFDHHSCAINE